MNDAAIYEASATHLHATVGYSEMRKRDSLFMWFLNCFVRWFNPRFMDDFHTTAFGRIYWADGARDWRTLWHECWHRKQARRSGEAWFSISYLFPQCLAAFVALAFLAFLWLPALWILVALVFLAPLPAPWRVRYEREAYLVSAVCDALSGWDIESDWYLDYQVGMHCDWAYYKPSWWRSRTRRLVQEDIARAARIARGEESTLYTDELLRIVKENG